MRIRINYDVVFDRAIFFLGDDDFSGRLDVFELLPDCHVAFDASRLGFLHQIVVEDAKTLTQAITNAVSELLGDTALDELTRTIGTSALDGPGLVVTEYSMAQEQIHEMTSTSWQAVHRQVRTALGRVELTAFELHDTEAQVRKWASALKPSRLLAALALPLRDAIDLGARFRAPTPQWLAAEVANAQERGAGEYCLMAETAERLGVDALISLHQVEENLEVHMKVTKPDAAVTVQIGEVESVAQAANSNLLIATFERTWLTDKTRPVLSRPTE